MTTHTLDYEMPEAVQQAVDSLITVIQETGGNAPDRRTMSHEAAREITAQHHYTEEAIAEDRQSREEAGLTEAQQWIIHTLESNASYENVGPAILRKIGMVIASLKRG